MPNLLDDPTLSLRERVQALRLPSAADDPNRGSGGRVWLPWALVLLLAACTASLAARVYTAPPPPKGAATAQAPGTAPPPVAAAPASAPPAAPGSTVLEAKGYIIPA